MRLGSLFDGSGGFPLAASMCGITPIWASEVEPYPIKVTKKNFPNMEHLGDVTKINGAEIEPVDIITFGSPCQDLSIAGNQKGLKHEEKGDDETTRSGLFTEAVRIITEMRFATNGRYPTFAVWENVPGAYSSQGGEDFRTVLEELARVAGPEVSIPRFEGWRNAGEILADGFSIAWRTFDAQYWGVPQRRKRIYLVADFRGQRAGEILFERDGLQGDFAQGKEARERIAEGAERGFGETGIGYWSDGIKCLRAEGENRPSRPSNVIVTAGFIGKNSPAAGSVGYCVGQAPTLCAGVQADVMCIAGNAIDRKPQNGGHHLGVQGDISYTLNTVDRHAVCFAQGKYDKYKKSDKGSTIKASGGNCGNGSENIILGSGKDVTGTLMANCATKQWLGNQEAFSGDYFPMQGSIVRRLTPLECCRLQGFPDWWCDGVEGSDSAQYKMWGNGIALPCALYVMQGIAKYAD